MGSLYQRRVSFDIRVGTIGVLSRRPDFYQPHIRNPYQNPAKPAATAETQQPPPSLTRPPTSRAPEPRRRSIAMRDKKGIEALVIVKLAASFATAGQPGEFLAGEG